MTHYGKDSETEGEIKPSKKKRKGNTFNSCLTFILGAAMTLNEALLERSGHFIFDEDQLQRSSTNRDVLIC